MIFHVNAPEIEAWKIFGKFCVVF